MKSKSFKKKSELLKWISDKTFVNATISGLTVNYESIVAPKEDEQEILTPTNVESNEDTSLLGRVFGAGQDIDPKED